jgi:RNA recognition motif-containing protein
MATKLYVNNISPEITEEELKQIFELAGTVVSAHIAIYADTGLQRDYGFVEMDTPESAENAVLALDNHILHARKMRVSVVLPREERKPVPRADLTDMTLKHPSRAMGKPRTR